MELQEKLALINENLVEVLNPELIEQPLTEGRNPKIYWVSSYSYKWPPPSYLF
jgi:tyrosyl-tRNA synthetase